MGLETLRVQGNRFEFELHTYDLRIQCALAESIATMIVHANRQCPLWVDVKMDSELQPPPSSSLHFLQTAVGLVCDSILIIIDLWLFGTYYKHRFQ